MRIAHLSDIHFCDKYLDEVNRCAVHACTWLLNQERPDLIVLSGDLFDHRLEQNSPALLQAMRRVCELGNIAPVLILQGTYSHDAPHAIDLFWHVHSEHPIYVADHIQQVALADGEFAPAEDFDMGIPEGGILISCLPAVNKGAVAAAVGAEAAAEAVGEHVAALLKGWAVSHRAAREMGIPSIVVSHGTVSGSLTEHGVPMAGLDHEYTVGTLFASEASAVMLGHIHKHQSWTGAGCMLPGLSPVIAYPGSLGRLHFGEYDPKGFLLWDVTPHGATFEFIETPARRLIDIDFGDASPDMDYMQELAGTLAAGSHVRVRFAVDEEHRHSVDKEAIAALFEAADQIKIEGRILPVQRQRAAGIGQAPSVADKLRKWCELTGSDFDPLHERLLRLTAGPVIETPIEHDHAA